MFTRLRRGEVENARGAGRGVEGHAIDNILYFCLAHAKAQRRKGAGKNWGKGGLPHFRLARAKAQRRKGATKT